MDVAPCCYKWMMGWMDWISPGGVKYWAPYGANNKKVLCSLYSCNKLHFRWEATVIHLKITGLIKWAAHQDGNILERHILVRILDLIANELSTAAGVGVRPGQRIWGLCISWRSNKYECFIRSCRRKYSQRNVWVNILKALEAAKTNWNRLKITELYNH